ncbi:hypothetical protein HK105_208860 [Polyrhizophydium stewartii]|uniref:Uncharacterized protein n=1 Tax=Polyrhizophydium stewartii TaxID=2732419 RepID=A0ABR4MWI5_9FUNG
MLLLVLFGLPRLWKLVSRPAFVAPVGFAYAAKLGSCFVLAAFALANLVALQSDRAALRAPVLSLSVGSSSAAYLLAAALHHYEYFYSRLSSSVLLFFWLANIVANAIVLRTAILLGDPASDPLLFSYIAASLALSLFVFIVENLPKQQVYYLSLDDVVNASPEATANIFSRLTFYWMDPLMRLGYEKDLEMDDLWNLKKTDTAAYNSEAFQKAWLRQLGRKRPSLLGAVAEAFGPVFLSSAVFKACQDILAFIQPQFLRQMMEFANSYSPESPVEPMPIYRGFVIAFCMLGAALLQTIMLHQYFHVCLITGMRIRSSIVTAVYRKALRLSSRARQSSTNGEITNLMSVDASRLSDLCTYLQILWSGPFQICMAVYFLYQSLGPSIFGGVAIMVLMIPVNAVLATKSRALGKEQMGNKDTRTKMMDELLSGIKVIKLYAWENSFLKKILSVREKELDTLKRMGYLSAVQSFTWACTPFLVSFTSFAIFSVVSGEPLTSTRVFVALSLFNLLQFPLSVFPSVISATVEASVSFSRLYRFLMNEELDESAVNYDPVPPFTHQADIERVGVQRGTFAWAPDAAPGTETLHNISFSVMDRQLVAIVGSVGAGKSSLVSALLGEMYKTAGTVTVRGTVAYVPQTAWIMNATLRDNILFGRNFDAKLYNETLDACGLRADLEMLPAGDETEIGERGINLSGGQKQRISMARAVYANADIYLLDDALSAVDAHVGRHIFDHVIGRNGMLRNKSRVFVTHAVHLLPETDVVIQLAGGAVAEMGTYQQLHDKHGAFYALMKEYGKRKQSLGTSDADLAAAAAVAAASAAAGSAAGSGLASAAHSRAHSAAPHDPAAAASSSAGGGGAGAAVSMTTPNPSNTTTATTAATATTATTAVDDSLKQLQTTTTPKKPTDGQIITKEDSAKGSVDWSVYRAYAMSCHLPSVVAFLFLAVFAQSLSVLQNVYLSWWANSNDRAEQLMVLAGWMMEPLAAASGASAAASSAGVAVTADVSVAAAKQSDAFKWLLGYGLIGLLSSLSIVAQVVFVWVFCGIRAARTLHEQMLRAIVRLPQSFFDTTPLGRVMNRFSKDQYTVDEVLPRSFQSYFRTMFAIASVLAVNTLGSPLFLVLAIPLAFLYAYFQRFYLSTSRELKRLDSTSRSPLYAHFQETLNGVSTIRAYKQEFRFIETNEERLDFNQRAYYPSVSSNRWLAVRLEFIGGLIVFGSALFGVLSIYLGLSTSASVIGLMLSYALNVTQTLNWMVRQSCEIETNVVAVERIKEYVELPQEAEYEVAEVARRLPDGWPREGQVEFKGYSTRYRPGLDLVLRDVTFSVRPHEKIGIVGRTGAGKSSLTLALFRLIEPAQGTILIDGVDITTLGLGDLRSRISIIPQDPVLFAESIRDNLDPFGQHSDAEIWSCLESASLRDYVSRLDGQLEYLVLPGGENFSVGQRQLICLARALLRRTSILVLDEATAAIDVETDRLIQQTIRREFKACTILTIAHRINTVMDSDRILVLDAGRVVEFDSPEALVKNKRSVFYSLAREAGQVR